MRLSARVEREALLRYTPAGLPVLEMWLSHQSRQDAFDYAKEVVCEIQAVLIGPQAQALSGVLSGQQVEVTGFIAQRSLKNVRLVLNIQHIELSKVS